MTFLSDGGENMGFIIGAIVGSIITGFVLCILVATSEGDNDAEE